MIDISVVSFVILYFGPMSGSGMNSGCWKTTQQCPTQTKWKQRARSFSCTSPKEYTCILSEELSLVELCMHVYPISKNTQDCPLISCFDGEPFLKSNFKPCPTNQTGCPPEGHAEYRSNELYKYSRCITTQGYHDKSTASNWSHTTAMMTTGENVRYGNKPSTHWINVHLCCVLTGACASVVLLSLTTYVIMLKRRLQTKTSQGEHLYADKQNFKRHDVEEASNKMIAMEE